MNEQESGEQVAVEVPNDDYVLHSETEAQAKAEPKVEQEAEAEEKPEANPQEGEPKKKGGFQKKIDRLSQSLTQKDQEVNFLKSELERMRSGTQEPAKSGEPNPDDFESFLEYNKAHTKWQASEIAKSLLKEEFDNRDKQAQELKAQQEYLAKEEKTNASILPVLEANPQYLETAQSFYEQGLVTPAIEAAFIDSDVPDKLLVHLVNNPAEMQALSQMNPQQVYRHIGKLEATLGTSETAARITKAPPPISPVKTSSSSTKDPDSMSFEEYNKWRNKGGG